MNAPKPTTPLFGQRPQPKAEEPEKEPWLPSVEDVLGFETNALGGYHTEATRLTVHALRKIHELESRLVEEVGGLAVLAGWSPSTQPLRTPAEYLRDFIGKTKPPRETRAEYEARHRGRLDAPDPNALQEKDTHDEPRVITAWEGVKFVEMDTAQAEYRVMAATDSALVEAVCDVIAEVLPDSFNEFRRETYRSSLKPKARAAIEAVYAHIKATGSAIADAKEWKRLTEVELEAAKVTKLAVGNVNTLENGPDLIAALATLEARLAGK